MELTCSSSSAPAMLAFKCSNCGSTRNFAAAFANKAQHYQQCLPSGARTAAAPAALQTRCRRPAPGASRRPRNRTTLGPPALIVAGALWALPLGQKRPLGCLACGPCPMHDEEAAMGVRSLYARWAEHGPQQLLPDPAAAACPAARRPSHSPQCCSAEAGHQATPACSGCGMHQLQL